MKKIVTLTALALSASSVMSQCSPNWITLTAGINNSGDIYNSNSPLYGSNSYLTCSNIRAGMTTCCSSQEVSTFQAKANALVDELKTAVSHRDQFIINRRNDVLTVKSSLNSIQSSLTTLTGQSLSYDLQNFLGFYGDIIEMFAQDFATLKDNFLNYQSSRATCFNRLVQAQVTLWCAACFDFPSDYGINTNTNHISFGYTFTSAISSACSDYINYALGQSKILSLYYISNFLSTLDSALKKLVNGDTSGADQELNDFFVALQGVTFPADNLEKPVYEPGPCVADSCDWLSDDLFGDGWIDKTFAVLGGYVISNARRLQTDAPADRMLQSFDMDPATESYGITVNFPTNPGNVVNGPDAEEEVEEEEEEEDDIENPNSAVRNGAIACAITALAALL